MKLTSENYGQPNCCEISIIFYKFFTKYEILILTIKYSHFKEATVV
jgi:hypothetical protein